MGRPRQSLRDKFLQYGAVTEKILELLLVLGARRQDRLREKTYVNAARDVVEYLWRSPSLRKQEVFIVVFVVFLDAKHGILTDTSVSQKRA
ncbi:MAG: hypothetical protein ACUVQV_06160 [Dissulfurimicrobium sp.]|uniref:hypothetical protein n=1 Tax=Dissulfurimicrobium sp. TaxID=2022436 RepID=UPI00404B5824